MSTDANTLYEKAMAGIDKFIGKAKREQRQAAEIAIWNDQVEARNRERAQRKAARRRVYSICMKGSK